MRVQYFIDLEGHKASASAVLSDWQPIAALNGDSLSRYLVRTVGYVLVEHADRRMQVSIDFDAVSNVAMVALAYALADHRQETRQPVFVDLGDKIVRRFDDGAAAIKYVASRMREPARRPRNCFHRRRVPLSGQSRAAFRQLAMLSLVRGAMDLSLVRQLLRRTFQHRYLIVRPDAESGRMILTEIGDGYAHLDERWRRRCIGAPFGEFDDPRYATFVKQAYRDAWNLRQPILEEIDALWSIGLSPPAMIHYDRLLVPVHLNDGPALLSATMVKT